MTEADDVGTGLMQASLEGQPLGVIGEGGEARLTIAIVAD